MPLDLLARDAAAHLLLDHSDDIAEVLGELREIAAEDQLTKLLVRDLAVHAPLDYPVPLEYWIRVLTCRFRQE